MSSAWTTAAATGPGRIYSEVKRRPTWVLREATFATGPSQKII